MRHLPSKPIRAPKTTAGSNIPAESQQNARKLTYYVIHCSAPTNYGEAEWSSHLCFSACTQCFARNHQKTEIIANKWPKLTSTHEIALLMSTRKELNNAAVSRSCEKQKSLETGHPRQIWSLARGFLCAVDASRLFCCIDFCWLFSVFLLLILLIAIS